MSQSEHADHLTVVPAIDLVLLANGENVMGRTALQKLVYFVSKRIPNSKIDFKPHYFGPYSAWIAATLADMYSLGQVYELPESMSGYTIYRYGLTPPGKAQAERSSKHYDQETLNIIQDIVDICQSKHQLNANKLAYAAKVHYVLTSDEYATSSQLTTNDAICQAADGFGWDMTDDNVKTGFELLKLLCLDPR